MQKGAQVDLAEVREADEDEHTCDCEGRDYDYEDEYGYIEFEHHFDCSVGNNEEPEEYELPLVIGN